MLVLSRKKGEKIVIGSNIEIVVVEVNGNRVKIGLVAPKEVPIQREELLRRMESETPFQVVVPCVSQGLS